MRGKKIDHETEGLILGFLRQKFSERLIINKLKKLKISVSKGVIYGIKQKIFSNEKTKEKKLIKIRKVRENECLLGRTWKN